MRSKYQTAKRIYRDDGPVQMLKAAGEDVARHVMGEPQYDFLATAVRSERSPGLGAVPFLTLLRRGFHSKAAVLYDFNEYDPADYLTHYERQKTRRINGSSATIVIDKFRFHEALSAYADHRPAIYGQLDDGRFAPDPDRPATADAVTQLEERLRDEDRLVLKPRGSGGGGHGVAVIERDQTGFRVNDQPLDRPTFAEWIGTLREYLVTEFVEQGEYAAGLFAHAANTIRVVTIVDDQGPFVAAAVQRIGTHASAPVDNWSAGGMSASIQADGTLSAAARLPSDGAVQWYTHHPDTGARISGTSVPDLEAMLDTLLRMAESIPDVVYIGWDILPTDDGFKVLEGNAHVDVNSIQVHEPLLTDPRVKRFYEWYGVLSRRSDAPTVVERRQQ